MRTAARAYLCAGVAATVVYVLAGGSEAIYESLGLCAAAAIVIGVRAQPAGRTRRLADAGPLPGDARRGRPRLLQRLRRLAALPLGRGRALPLGGRRVRDRARPARRARPSTAAISSPMRMRSSSPSRSGCCMWSALFEGSLGSGASIERVVSVGYPVLDVVLLAALLRVFFVRGDRTWSYAAVTTAVALLLLSDCLVRDPGAHQPLRRGHVARRGLAALLHVDGSRRAAPVDAHLRDRRGRAGHRFAA